ncbi:MAG: Asp-tRNA(Asn)/Glu-tRNA(Gln) amidotransferase subunit GatB [Thermoleophilaceae bacterium]
MADTSTTADRTTGDPVAGHLGGAAPAADPAERRYEPVIGLEIHVQLATATKMFCACALSFGEEPNTRTCPVCLGHPGTLPVPNARAVHFGLMIGMALECEIASAVDLPPQELLLSGPAEGLPDLPVRHAAVRARAPRRRAHPPRAPRGGRREARARGRLGAHPRGRGLGGRLQPRGTPLVEIVTEPDLRSAGDAAEWLRLLRVTLRQLGVSDVNMDEGSLRCDANVSLRPAGTADLGVKTELKNMNSFRFLERGVEAEIARQEELLRAGQGVVQETLHFDPVSGSLSPLRSKEEAHDYRYLPEPDLVPLAPSARDAAGGPRGAARAARGPLRSASAPTSTCPVDTARMLAFSAELGDFFEASVAASGDRTGADPRELANWVVGELKASLGDADPSSSQVRPEALAELAGMVARQEISRAAGRQVLEIVAAEGGAPAAIVAERGLARAETSELEGVVERAVADNADAVEKVRAGKTKAMGAIVGAVMRETRGRADGDEVRRMIEERIGA